MVRVHVGKSMGTKVGVGVEVKVVVAREEGAVER